MKAKLFFIFSIVLNPIILLIYNSNLSEYSFFSFYVFLCFILSLVFPICWFSDNKEEFCLYRPLEKFFDPFTYSLISLILFNPFSIIFILNFIYPDEWNPTRRSIIENGMYISAAFTMLHICICYAVLEKRKNQDFSQKSKYLIVFLCGALCCFLLSKCDFKRPRDLSTCAYYSEGMEVKKYWVSTQYVRHNKYCHWFYHCKGGATDKKVGKPCSNCGG